MELESVSSTIVVLPFWGRSVTGSRLPSRVPLSGTPGTHPAVCPWDWSREKDVRRGRRTFREGTPVRWGNDFRKTGVVEVLLS